jgi:hypothetical protein
MTLTFYTSRLALALGTAARLHHLRMVRVVIPVTALIMTLLHLSKLHETDHFITVVGAILYYVIVALFISFCGLMGPMISILLSKKTGSICLHTLTLEDDGLQEETEVNRSLHFYRDVGRAYKRLGVWIIPAGPGCFVFRESEVTEGLPAMFAEALQRHRHENGNA